MRKGIVGIGRRVTPAVAAVVLLVAAGSPAQAAIEVVGSESTWISWLPATGPVEGYLVYTSVNGSEAALAATLPAGTTFTTLQAQYGDTVVMWIGTYDEDFNVGPLSDPSPEIHFVAAIDGDPATSDFTPFDFNGDEHADVAVRNPTTGQIAVWMMDGTTVQSASTGLPDYLGSNWKVVATGDFNGDDNADMVWRADDGTLSIWLMEKGELAGGIAYKIDSGWQVRGAADLDGDGRDDLVFSHSSGLHYAWLMYGLDIASHGPLGNPGTDWTIVATPDLNLDGKADLLWRHSSGSVYAWIMDGLSIASHGAGTGAPTEWTIVGTPDLDGNGTADLLWRHDSGALYAWFMDGVTIVSHGGMPSPTSDWTLVGLRDFDADGCDDLLWEHDDGLIYAWLMDGTTLADHGGVGSPGAGFEVVPN